MTATKRPTSVRIGAVNYCIVVDPDTWLKHEHKNRNFSSYGYTDHITATILINPKLPPEVTRLTLWHEMLHALFETVMGSPDLSNLGSTKDDREEAMIRYIESPTLLALRDNPDLTHYLLAEL